jgi:TRAP-type C4-dicarboxylate transport system permease small subunit
LRVTVARTLAIIAAAFVAAMMLLTVADVASRKIAEFPIRGVVELVELLLACSFFIALPAVFLNDENLVVDSIDGWAPRWVQFLKRISLLLGAVVLAVMGWQGWIAAKDTIEFNDVTSDLSIPRIYYWLPVLFGIIAAAIAALVMLFPRRTD